MKLSLKTFVLGLAVASSSLTAYFMPSASAASTLPPASWHTIVCLDTKAPPAGPGQRACFVYYMEIRLNATTHKYYSWAEINPVDDQQDAIQVTGVQIDKINLGDKYSFVSWGPLHSKDVPSEVDTTKSTTPQFSPKDSTSFAMHLFYSVRYNIPGSSKSLVVGQSGLLHLGQHN